MFQWSDDFNAETILHQVFESSFSDGWFLELKECKAVVPGHENCLGIVVTDLEPDDPFITKEDHRHIFPEMIDNVMITTYTNWMDIPPDHPRFKSFASWVEDLDANDVDIILQMALFGEIIYG